MTRPALILSGHILAGLLLGVLGALVGGIGGVFGTMLMLCGGRCDPDGGHVAAMIAIPLGLFGCVAGAASGVAAAVALRSNGMLPPRQNQMSRRAR
jgi:hypothetical protein